MQENSSLNTANECVEGWAEVFLIQKHKMYEENRKR